MSEDFFFFELLCIFRKNNAVVKFILLLFCFTVFFVFAYSQSTQTDSVKTNTSYPVCCNDHVFKDNIRSVLIYKEGWELSYPVIDLNSASLLVLSFDDMDADAKDFSYTFIHCDADWKPSAISPSDYLDGFAENKISNPQPSFNTTCKYSHYSITFPNEDVTFRISGNYIVKVYMNFDQNEIVFTKRFFVVESKVSIDATVKQAVMSDFRKTAHEVDFIVNKQNYKINDVYSEIKVTLLQNMRWDNAITTLKPVYVKDETLVYDFDEENVFLAGGEFRYFDIKTLRLNAEKVDQISFIKSLYHVKLLDDEKRTIKTYQYHKDLNGKYLVKTQDGQNSEVDADYAIVYFTLPCDVPFAGGNLYVTGNLANWEFTEYNQMKYNFERKQYESVLQLKQGYYNYQYLFLKDGEQKADVSAVEGSHYETENDYLIFVYHKDFSNRYDKLIGYQIANSVIRNK